MASNAELAKHNAQAMSLVAYAEESVNGQPDVAQAAAAAAQVHAILAVAEAIDGVIGTVNALLVSKPGEQ